jgi:hypothetical protein
MPVLSNIIVSPPPIINKLIILRMPVSAIGVYDIK